MFSSASLGLLASLICLCMFFAVHPLQASAANAPPGNAAFVFNPLRFPNSKSLAVNYKRTLSQLRPFCPVARGWFAGGSSDGWGMKTTEQEFTARFDAMVPTSKQFGRELSQWEDRLNQRRKALNNLHKKDRPKKDIVKLNVGGERIDIKRSTIMQGSSRLSWILSGRSDDKLLKDSKGRFFFDYDPAWLLPIINYLRDQSLELPEECGVKFPVPSASGSRAVKSLLYDNLTRTRYVENGVAGSDATLRTSLKLEEQHVPAETACNSTASALPAALYEMDLLRDYMAAEWQRCTDCERQLQAEEDWLAEEQKFVATFLQNWGKVCEVPGRNNEVVIFSAGGRVFQASRAVLCCEPTSLLHELANTSAKDQDTDSDGNIFVDVDPDCFAKILSHLRNKALQTSSVYASVMEGGQPSSSSKSDGFQVSITPKQKEAYFRIAKHFRLDPADVFQVQEYSRYRDDLEDLDDWD